MPEHSCLFEAIATALGLASDVKPISKLRGICTDQLDRASEYYKNRWDGLDGFGNPMSEWGEFVQMVQTDMPAGFLEVEAIANALHLSLIHISEPTRLDVI
eukprot:3725166-Prorocentrum_lima.AAC.1